ncbi:hypothetical protein DFH29DRAFT_921829 [Suillus ampliporus]|nr:hypothetical protein DFH29DRAFT_921829 [Suillus ampliporus]
MLVVKLAILLQLFFTSQTFWHDALENLIRKEMLYLGEWQLHVHCMFVALFTSVPRQTNAHCYGDHDKNDDDEALDPGSMIYHLLSSERGRVISVPLVYKGDISCCPLTSTMADRDLMQVIYPCLCCSTVCLLIVWKIGILDGLPCPDDGLQRS